MAYVLLAAQCVILILLAVFLRRHTRPTENPRLAQLPDQITRFEARAEARADAVERSIAQLRTDLAADSATSRQASLQAAASLRTEVLQTIQNLGSALNDGLASFRTDNKASAETLRTSIHHTLESLNSRFIAFSSETARTQLDAQTALHAKLADLAAGNSAHQDKLRSSVESSLNTLSKANEAKLEQMRETVDEKLHKTLHSRLTESFGQVTDQLNKVHTGLGEMTKLSEGVDGLSRIFTNVKSRGGFAEVQLGVLLRQMLAPGQFIENANVKFGTAERVEYAVRFPTNAGERLLPIDAKFPLEAWERLESAYEANAPDAIQREGRAFENAIRTEAERICKYINPPMTTPYGIMFLPTEGLYAEVIRRESLQAEVQSRCHVTIAGPTTLSAILTSFQMGFHMLALQEKGDEVWKVLEKTKTEFRNFEVLMGSMERQVGTVQTTIQKLGVRTRAINKSLAAVSDTGDLDLFEDLTNVVPMLAAEGEN